jgi:Asp-tRNA(Asn)/Glu-tRNA(Gln) amidotransferase A subunit family amidase
MGGRLGAFTYLDPVRAIAEAQESNTAASQAHPLRGVPVAVKDNIDVAGMPSRAGSQHFSNVPAERDATAVARLRAAGAIVIGKTAMHQFAYGPTGDRSVSGPVRNPHALGRMARGSSAGSGAAVAAGIVPIAIGTDTGGSVRIPAALCGVVGFKPAHRAVPMEGVLPLAPDLDDIGVLAATVEDCKLAAEVLVGHGAIAEASTTPRIAWLPPSSFTPVDPGVESMARAVLPPHDEVRLTEPITLLHAFNALQSGQVYALHAERVQHAPQLYDAEVLKRLRAAARVPAWHYVRALDTRERAADELSLLLTDIDVLALPTVPVVAPALGRRRLRINSETVTTRQALLSLTCVWNLVGYPAITIPVGKVGGLPVGLQLVAVPGREPTLFAAATAVQHSVAPSAQSNPVTR